MNDQQRSTPQPFDDGPRSAVDPHLLPASARQPRVPAAEQDAPLTSSTEPADSTQPASEPGTHDADHGATNVDAPAETDTHDPSQPHDDSANGYDVVDAPSQHENSPANEYGAVDAPHQGSGAPADEYVDGEFSDANAQDAAATDVAGTHEHTATDAAGTHEHTATDAAGANDYNATDAAPGAESTAHDPDTIDADATLATEPGASTDDAEGTGVTTERTRLDEALERSRTIPYEQPQAANETAADTTEASTTETKVIDTDHTVASDTYTTTESDEKSDLLLAAERRRDDEAFEEAMLGTTSTEGLIMPPSKRGNRTFALIMAVITTVIFAAAYAFLFASARFIFTPGADILGDAWAFVGTAAFYVPVVLFAIVMILWSVLSNRAGWWSYLLASVVLAIIAFGGHYIGIAGQEVINGGTWSNQALFDAIRAPENLPGALIAFIAARETSGWLGGLIGARGRRLTRLNKRDAEEYDRRVREERELSGFNNPVPAGSKS